MLVVTARYGEEIGEGPLNKGRDIYESQRTKVTYSPVTNGRGVGLRNEGRAATGTRAMEDGVKSV